MEIQKHKNNLRTLFGVTEIPKESQLRDVLDDIPSDIFADIFKDIFSRLRRHKHLEDFAILPNLLLCVIDGTQYTALIKSIVNIVYVKHIKKSK